MKKMVFAPLALLLLVLLGLSGCGQLSGSGSVAVLDLQRALKESGLVAQIGQDMAGARQRGLNELAKLRDRLNTQLKKVKDSLGDKPSEEDQAKFEAQLRQANQVLVKNRRQVGQTLQNLRNRLYRQARQRALAATREVTQANGIKLVALRGSVFDYQPEVDITDAVLARMGKAAPAASRPAAPPPKPEAKPETEG